MKGSIIRRVQHTCVGGTSRWVQLPAARGTKADVPRCEHCNADVTKGLKRYDCTWRAGRKQLRKTFNDLKQAERFLTNTVKQVQDGNYTAIRPTDMETVFDEWLKDVEVKVKQRKLQYSTVSSYKSMLEKHLRPAFESYRSDRLTHDAIHKCVCQRNLAPV